MPQKRNHGTSLILEDLLTGGQRRGGTGDEMENDQLAFVDYGYLFPSLAFDPSATLVADDNLSTSAIIAALKRLGYAMVERASLGMDSDLPAAYTYFGQFIDHDITLEAQSKHLQPIDVPDFAPLPETTIRQQLKNLRTSPFDLDSVYGRVGMPPHDIPVPRHGEKLALGKNSRVGSPIPGKTNDNDLMRVPAEEPWPHFRAKQALIGDERNDENLITSQMHVAFLKLHNAFVDTKGLNFADARVATIQHYQAVVLFDFLRKICDETVVTQTLVRNRLFLSSCADRLYMPLEFSAAAYRFGHSMVRDRYILNRQHDVKLPDLLSFTELSGNIGPADSPTTAYETLPRDRIIEWQNFLPISVKKPVLARPIDTLLAHPLTDLREEADIVFTDVMKHLAQRNLLRGYLLRLPTGQSIARALLRAGLLDQQMLLMPATIRAHVSPTEQQALDDPAFQKGTPLWYYILAEAKILREGKRLGPLGSMLVAETIIGLLRRSPHSILNSDQWQPQLGNLFPTHVADLTLRDLIIFAGLGDVVER
ncbi:MAG TPA: peroxidase family protein [Caldilineaceae bacterium]|nr:peroxidase family protein [Caldilineaceae bacterium]